MIAFPGVRTDSNPEAEAFRSEIRRLLEHAVDTLPEPFRIVFVMREIDDRISPVAELFIGKRALPRRPSEYLARNVRATPLSGGNDQPLLEIMRELPDDMIVFSSDFPHFEGFTDPMGHYAEALRELPADRRARFLGGSIAEVFARMQDPIVPIVA